MIQKRPLDSRRLRSRPPRGFGWLDHRLLRQGYLARCSPPAMALYCLLVCAGDERGLSFYSDPRIGALLGLEPALLPRVRRELVELGLVAYQKPLYQVLALDDAVPLRDRSRSPGLPAPAPLQQPLDGRRASQRLSPSKVLSVPKRLPAAENSAPAPVTARGGLSLRAMVAAALAVAREGGPA